MTSAFETPREKKDGPSTTIVAVSDSHDAVEVQAFKPKRMTAAIWTIVGGVALPCIPVIIVTTILLWVIFHHRIVISSGWPELQIAAPHVHTNFTTKVYDLRHEGGPAYYVQFNPSTITTIASWTSRIIPYLSSSIMALVAFFAARSIVLKSRSGDGLDLPSPEQLTILIGILGGNGFGPLKDTLVHRYRRKERLVAPLPAAFSVLFIITLLGLIIPILDSWFGIATTAKTITQLYPRNSTLSFGRGLASSCGGSPRDASNDDSFLYTTDAWWPCGMFTPIGHPFIVVKGVDDAERVISGVSSQNKVLNYTDHSGTVYFYLADSAQNSLVDFKARTIAATSQCVPMTQKCYSSTNDNNTVLFNCTPAFTGYLEQNSLNKSAVGDYEDNPTPLGNNVGLAFAKNADLTEAGDIVFGGNVDDGNWTLPAIYPTNPLYYGVWATGYPAPDGGVGTPSLLNDGVGDTGIYYEPEIMGGVWQLNCSTTVHEISYTWVDGGVATFNHTLASTDMAAMLSAPYALAPNLSYVATSLFEMATVAGIENSSRTIADAFAMEFSKYLISYSVGTMDPQINELEQARNSTINVARIPMVPLYLLLATKILYVLAVLVLAIGAYCFTHPAETEVVKAQLSVKGLAAAHFNQPDLLQANVVKQIKSRLETSGTSETPPVTTHVPGENGTSPISTSGPSEKQPAETNTPPLQHTASMPPPKTAKVGLLQNVDGTWQFAVVADGVWNTIKPIVESLVVGDAKAGDLGAAGAFVSAWH